MARGRFITLEGGEGAGKSTQVARLENRLHGAGIATLVTREPGGTALGERIRDLLLAPEVVGRSPVTETLLFCAARFDHVKHLIQPALAKSTWVLSDRFADSTRAYQGAGDGVPDHVLTMLEDLVVGQTMPDMTVLLDLPAKEGLRRAGERSGRSEDRDRDRFEARDIAFHEKLRDGFLAIAGNNPGRICVLDGLHSPDELENEIWEIVARRFEV